MSLISILYVLQILHSGNYFNFSSSLALSWAITVSCYSKRNLFQNTNLKSSAIEKLHPYFIYELQTASEVNNEKLL